MLFHQLCSDLFVGLTAQRWREGVLGVHIPPPAVPDYMRICIVCDLPGRKRMTSVRQVAHVFTRDNCPLLALPLGNVNYPPLCVDDI